MWQGETSNDPTPPAAVLWLRRRSISICDSTEDPDAEAGRLCSRPKSDHAPCMALLLLYWVTM